MDVPYLISVILMVLGVIFLALGWTFFASPQKPGQRAGGAIALVAGALVTAASILLQVHLVPNFWAFIVFTALGVSLLAVYAWISLRKRDWLNLAVAVMFTTTEIGSMLRFLHRPPSTDVQLLVTALTWIVAAWGLIVLVKNFRCKRSKGSAS